MTVLETLSAWECEGLLRSQVFGRVVLPTSERTEIVPVNYAAMGDAVLIRTGKGSLLDRNAHGAELILEVDHVDHERWLGWSVVARGPGERLTEDDLTLAERGAPGPPRWVSGARDVWIRLRWVELTGRRLGTGWDLSADLPVRRAWR